MEEYYPGQRWTSDAEPELGLGIVIETSKGRVTIQFPNAKETRMYAADNAPLRRLRFKIGDTIFDMDGRTMQVESMQEEDHLMIYLGHGRKLSEARLGNVAVKHGAEDRLMLGDIDTPQFFALRRQTLQFDQQRRISPVNGFLGGRIDLIPHQLYIAHEVSNRFAPRVLLSDEVGLGKTIEACLILHRLLLSGRASRVLILVPDSLLHQWFVEMLRRFNLWFHIFDEERCASLESGAPEGNPFLDDQLILCSTSFLAGSRKRAAQALSATWDMLVVDEAHHLEWSLEKVSAEYQVVEALSQQAQGLLLLTATPEQLGIESHFARLRLLDPERYADFEAFKAETIHHRATADLVEQIQAGRTLDPSAAEMLTTMLGPESLAVLAADDAEAKSDLLQDLLDQHGPGRVIFRNRRQTMQGFPKRVVHLIPLEHNPAAVSALQDEFLGDIAFASQQPMAQAFQYEEDPRLEWLVKFMQQIQPAKVLLICNRKEKVLAIEEYLRTRVNWNVGVFHEDLSLVQRDRNAAYFSESDGARLLICSEIGSEGRNFQFAHHLILFDLPLHPELLEQRIGRLDRIGQTEDIKIHIPYLETSAQAALATWYHHGLNAFAQNLEGGDKIAQRFREHILEIAQMPDSPARDSALEGLVAETQVFQTNLRATLAQGRDRLLEMNSFKPEVAERLIDQIKQEDAHLGLESWLLTVFEQYNIDVEDLAPRTYLLHAPHGNAAAFPSMPDEGMSITFDRKRALSREEMSFMSWDHPMATGAIDLVLSSGQGSASYAKLLGSKGKGIVLELLFVLGIPGSQGKPADRFLPNTLIRVLVDHAGRDVSEDYPITLLNQQLRAAEVDELLDNETLVETILPNMIAAATKIAEDAAEIEIIKALSRLKSSLGYEIHRLKILQTKNKHIRPEEIQIAQDEQAQLQALISAASIRLDALQLIQSN